MKLLLSTVLLSVALLLSACRDSASGDDGASGDSIPEPRVVSTIDDSVRNAPHELEIGGKTIAVELRAIRDFAPSLKTPISQRGTMTAAFRVTVPDRGNIPKDLHIVAGWLIHNGQCWEMDLDREHVRVQSLEASSRYGPRWEVGSMVDGVVKLKDAQGTEYMLKAKPVAISKSM